jgi:uncharacterized membrane protein YeiH
MLPTLLDILDLLGVAVFAVSGALAAGRAGLDLLGVIVLASLTAIGGGTLRDLLLNRHPIFWLRDGRYAAVIVASALLTVLYVRFFPPPGAALLVADAFGLALFAISGAQVAEAARLPAFAVVLMGTMSGAGGGVLRDVMSARVPLILRSDIYASAAIAGVCLYLVAKRMGAPRGAAVGLGLAAVVGLRLGALAFGWQLPVFRLAA